jgi:hypothetical protein
MLYRIENRGRGSKLHTLGFRGANADFKIKSSLDVHKKAYWEVFLLRRRTFCILELDQGERIVVIVTRITLDQFSAWLEDLSI